MTRLHARILAVSGLAVAALAPAFATDVDVDAPEIAAAKGAASRDGSRLTLRFRSGATRIFEDAPACEIEEEQARCVAYVLNGYHPEWHLFRVAIHFYEGGDDILIDDRTGDETVIDGFAQFSSSGNHIVEILAGPDGYDASGPAVQIWRRRGSRFVVEWRSGPNGEDAQYELVDWPSPGRLELRSRTPGHWDHAAKQMTPDSISTFTLKRRPKGWRVMHHDD